MLVLSIWPFLKKEWLIISVLKDDSWLSLEVYIELVKKMGYAGHLGLSLTDCHECLSALGRWMNITFNACVY